MHSASRGKKWIIQFCKETGVLCLRLWEHFYRKTNRTLSYLCNVRAWRRVASGNVTETTSVEIQCTWVRDYSLTCIWTGVHSTTANCLVMLSWLSVRQKYVKRIYQNSPSSEKTSPSFSRSRAGIAVHSLDLPTIRILDVAAELRYVSNHCKRRM